MENGYVKSNGNLQAKNKEKRSRSRSLNHIPYRQVVDIILLAIFQFIQK